MAKRQYKPMLSKADENLPDDYVGIYDIFSDKRYCLPKSDKNAWCIGEKRLYQMRLKTYQEVKKRFDVCNALNFSNFWNGNVDAINDLGLNQFANLIEFKELASAMICFESPVENDSNGNLRIRISWGIKKSIYRAFYDAQKESLQTGEPQRRVKLYDPRKKRSGNLYKQIEIKAKFNENGETKILTLERNAVYTQFEHWCKIKGIGKANGMYQAMLLIMQQYPATGLKDIGAYERKTDLGWSEIIIPDRSEKDYVSVFSKIPKQIHKQMSEIILRFNMDVSNIGKPDMTIDKYIIQAVELLNKKSPLKYSNPGLYKKYIEAKEAKAYNEAVLKLKK